MSAHRENPAKIYVSVRADHLLNGRIRPLMFRAKDGPVVRIDRILDEREAPSLKAGGQGMRYTCRVGLSECFPRQSLYRLPAAKRTEL